MTLQNRRINRAKNRNFPFYIILRERSDRRISARLRYCPEVFRCQQDSSVRSRQRRRSLTDVGTFAFRRLWRKQRAIRSDSGQNLACNSEQQILGTATEIPLASAFAQNDIVGSVCAESINRNLLSYLSLRDLRKQIAAISMFRFYPHFGKKQTFGLRLHPQGVRRIRSAPSSLTAAQPRRFAPRNDITTVF